MSFEAGISADFADLLAAFAGLKVEPTCRQAQVPNGPSVVLNTFSIGGSALVGWRW